MTKSQEKGENEVTDEAKREAARTGQDICDILNAMLKAAKAVKNSDRVARTGRQALFQYGKTSSSSRRNPKKKPSPRPKRAANKMPAMTAGPFAGKERLLNGSLQEFAK